MITLCESLVNVAHHLVHMCKIKFKTCYVQQDRNTSEQKSDQNLSTELREHHGLR